jgi:glycerol kinase
MPFVLPLDEGTTSARAALYDEQGRNAAMKSTPVECRYPHPGWVEQDAERSGTPNSMRRACCWMAPACPLPRS